MTMHSRSETLSFDESLDALASPYRRQLLLAMLAANPQADSDVDPLDILDDPETSDVTEAQLVHTHLPKLEAMGVVDWDRETGNISKGPEWERVAPLLVLIDDHREELPDGFL